MSLPYLYNQSFNYTVDIIVTPEAIASISLYPLIFILLAILPLIFFTIIFALKLPYRPKALLFFLNGVFSAIIPFITNSLISYLSILQYIYVAVTNDLNLLNILLNFTSLTAGINQSIVFLCIGMVILNIIFAIFYTGLSIKEKQNI